MASKLKSSLTPAAKAEPRRRRGRPPSEFAGRPVILAGAALAFSEKGYAGTAVEDICKASNVSRATFYRFFGSKEEVFSVLFDVSTKMLLQAVRAAFERFTLPLEKVEAAIDAYIGLQAGSSALAREFMLEAMRPTSPLAGRYRETMMRFGQMLAKEYTSVRKKEIDPFLLEGLLAAMERVLFLLGTQTGGKQTDIDRCKRVLLRIIIATLSEGEAVPPLPTIEK